MSSINDHCNRIVNALIPSDAFMLRKIYRTIAHCSQEKGWTKVGTSVILPRLFLAPSTIAVAALGCVGYGARGISRSATEILDGNFSQAIKALVNDELSALKCLALTVANVAYAVLGLFIGSSFFALFLPEVTKAEEIETLTNKIETLKEREDKLAKEIEIKKNQLNSKELLKENEQLTEQVERLKSHLKTSKSELAKETIQLTQLSSSTSLIIKDNEHKVTQLENEIAVLNEQHKQDLCRISALEEVKKEALLVNEKLKTFKNRDQDALIIEDLTNEREDLSKSINNLNQALKQASIPIKSPELILTNSPQIAQPSANEGGFFGGLNYVIKTSFYAVSHALKSLGRGGYFFYKFAHRMVHGDEDPWKDQRYQIGNESRVKFLHQVNLLEVDFKSIANITKNETGKRILEYLENAKNALQSNMLIRDVKTTFFKNIDKALLLIQSDHAHGIPIELVNKLNEFCSLWMTEGNLAGIGLKSVLYVAANGNPECLNQVKDSQVPFSQKLKGLLKGITSADDRLKQPKQDAMAAKLLVVTDNFSPLRESNIPNQIAKTTYQIDKGEKLETIHFRTGVPIGPKDEEISVNKPWDLNNVTLLPDYIAFLNNLRAKEKKLLVVLHLDPAYYNTSEGSLKNSQFGSTKVNNLYREAMWTKMMIDASKSEYADVMSVAIVPMDGTWLNQEIFNHKRPLKQDALKSIDGLIEHLMATITKINSPYLLPNMTGEQKQAFCQEIAERVKKDYFWPFEPYTKLTQDQMLAYVGIFDAYLIEALQIKEKANYVQRNCKDGIDRTMSFVGSELYEKLLRLKKVHDEETQMNLLGTTLSPALGVMKRELLHSRQDLLLKTIEYLEWLQLPEQQKKLPSQSQASKENAISFKLENVEFPESAHQALYPPASQATDDKLYKRILTVEEKHSSFALPNGIFTVKPEMKEGEFLEEALKMLQDRYQNELYSVEKIEGKTKRKNDNVIKTSFQLIHKNSHQQKAIFPVKMTINNNTCKISYAVKSQDKEGNRSIS